MKSRVIYRPLAAYVGPETKALMLGNHYMKPVQGVPSITVGRDSRKGIFAVVETGHGPDRLVSHPVQSRILLARKRDVFNFPQPEGAAEPSYKLRLLRNSRDPLAIFASNGRSTLSIPWLSTLWTPVGQESDDDPWMTNHNFWLGATLVCWNLDKETAVDKAYGGDFGTLQQLYVRYLTLSSDRDNKEHRERAVALDELARELDTYKKQYPEIVPIQACAIFQGAAIFVRTVATTPDEIQYARGLLDRAQLLFGERSFWGWEGGMAKVAELRKELDDKLASQT